MSQEQDLPGTESAGLHLQSPDSEESVSATWGTRLWCPLLQPEWTEWRYRCHLDWTAMLMSPQTFSV